MNFENSLEFAKSLDKADQLASLREQFQFPEKFPLYFAGHSLGLMPKRAKEYVNEELEAWGKYAVEGHFHGKHPWLPYHENITQSFASLVGALPAEVVAMNTLTVNLHLLMVSFYRPTKDRYKILIENNSFPSDKYAVDSQARFHGYADAVEELKPAAHRFAVDEEQILETIQRLGSKLSLVMLGNCNYLSGQYFNVEKIVKAAHQVGAKVGFNLAHGAGNLKLSLHDWGADFAVWCSYKYLNSGPGGLAGAYIHERHLGKRDIPRFEGWWGHNKDTRFKMGPQFDPIPTAEAWQLSNPPIWQLASLRASMEIFDQATMAKVRDKGDLLTGFFEYLIEKNLSEVAKVLTPKRRGSMLCLQFKKNAKEVLQKLQAQGAILDFREPDILRATPVALYNSFTDVYQLVQLMQEALDE